MDNYFKLYWKDGNCETLAGDTIADAFTKAGYGNGALADLDNYKVISPDVKIDVLYRLDNNRLNYGYTNRCCVFDAMDNINIDSIWDAIWNAMCRNEIKCLYIDKDFYNCRRYSHHIAALNLNELSYTFYEQDVSHTNIVGMRIYPLSNKALGNSLDIAIDKLFPGLDVRNGVFQLNDEMCEFSNLYITENLVTFGNKEVMLSHEDIHGYNYIKEYFFVLDRESLKSSKIEIFCDIDLMPHVIGKGGRNVKRLKEKLHAKGFTNVKRIEIKEVVS